MKIYIYKNCDACRKALKWLDAQEIAYEALPIREMPPTVSELKSMLDMQGGRLKSLFNTAGRDYKELALKDRLPMLSDDEAFELLSVRGNLVKRPFLIAEAVGLLGFSETTWSSTLLKK